MADPGRIAVGLIAGSTAVHLTLAQRAMSTEASLLLVGMAVACLACVPALWRGGSTHSWMTMLALTGVMLFAHLEFCFSCGPTVHEESGLGTHLFGDGLGSAAIWLMAAEMTLAATAVVRLTLAPHHNQPHHDRKVVSS